jgi:very-short-patch-repair endonuclease
MRDRDAVSSSDPIPVLRRLGGSARRADLLAEGVTDRGLVRAIRAGLVRRVGRGVVTLRDADPMILAAVRCGGLLTCNSAAGVLGLSVLRRGGRTHVASQNYLPGRGSEVILHRRRATRYAGPLPVADPLDCVSHALRCLPALSALVIADSAVGSGRVSTEEVSACLVGPGSVRARTLLGMVDANSESLLETIARVVLRVRGLHVETQVEVPGVGRVDLLVEGVLVVELDGFDYHADRAHYRNDRRRGNALACLGLRLVRFTYEDVVHRPRWVVTCVREALYRSRPSTHEQHWD